MNSSQNGFDLARAAVGNEHGARTVLIDAAAGTGVRGALVEVFAQLAARRAVLIVTTRMNLLEQWRDRLLNADSALPVGRFDTQVALELARRDAPPAAPGVYLATTAQLSHGHGRASLMTARFHLVVFDDLPQVVGRLAAGVEGLTRSCDRVVVLGSSLTVVTWPEPTERIRVSFDHAASEPTEILMLATEVTNAERDVEGRARQLLADLGGVADYQNRSQIHSALIREITRIQADPQPAGRLGPALLDQAWQLVDALESLGPDPLVASLLESVSLSVSEGPVFIVTSDLLADVQYVVSALADAGFRADVLPPRDRTDSVGRLAELAPGDVVVITPLGVELLDHWPDRSSIVLWHSPRTDGPAADRLLRFAATARRVVVLDGRADVVDRIGRDLRRLDQDKLAADQGVSSGLCRRRCPEDLGR